MIDFDEISGIGRVSLWRARRTSRRFSPSSCCSVNSSLPSPLSGQVQVCLNVFRKLNKFVELSLRKCIFSFFLQVDILYVKPLTSSLLSAWVWCTCSTSASTESLSSNPLPAGQPTLRGWLSDKMIQTSLFVLNSGMRHLDFSYLRSI